MLDDSIFGRMTRAQKLAYIRAKMESASQQPRSRRSSVPRRPYATKTAEQKFWRRVRQEGDCWLWQRGPFLSVEKGKAISARFWAVEHFTGRQPAGKLFSTCGHVNCVLPAHQREFPKDADAVPADLMCAILNDARPDYDIAADYQLSRSKVARIRQTARLAQIAADRENIRP